MMDRKNLVSLMKFALSADKNKAMTYSVEGQTLSLDAINKTVRDELNEYAKDYYSFNENINKIFSLITEAIDEVLPKKVMEQYGKFATVKTFAQGDKAEFSRKLGRTRAKQFITKVANEGVYETFKLGKEKVSMNMEAIGGAAQASLESILDGEVDFSDLIQIILEGMDDAIYAEIAKALISTIDSLPTANKVSTNEFNEASFDKLLAVASAYGDPVIYCTKEFAMTMMPADKWISNGMKDERWAKGYFTTYKGHQVIVMPQSFTDETNSQKVIDPSYAWIMPSTETPVYVGFEGNTIMRQLDNQDWSKEFQAYKKFGVATIVNSGICSYRNTSLTF